MGISFLYSSIFINLVNAPIFLLLLHAGDSIFAIDTTPIVEIVPMVLLRKVPSAAKFIAGIFNYRGEIIPVIDLCQLIQDTPCQIRYSTRIVVIDYATQDGVQRLGLMAERVTETMSHSEPLSQSSAMVISNAPYLGEVFMHEQNTIQRINWEPLVSIAQNAATLIGGTLQTNGAGRN